MKISVLGAAAPAKGIIFLGCYSTQRSLNLIIPMRWLREPFMDLPRCFTVSSSHCGRKAFSSFSRHKPDIGNRVKEKILSFLPQVKRLCD